VPDRVFTLTFARAPFIAGKTALERGDIAVRVGIDRDKLTGFEMAPRDAGIAGAAVLR
jgi:hypothetical protein